MNHPAKKISDKELRVIAIRQAVSIVNAGINSSGAKKIIDWEPLANGIYKWLKG